MAEQYVNSHYGNLILADEPIHDPKKNQWQVTMKCNYPRIIVDDGHPANRELYFVTLNNLGNIILDNDGKITNFTSRDIINRNIEDYMNIWKDRIERIILKSTSDRLVFSPTIQHFMNPLRRIISTILLTGKISERDIKSFPKSDRAYEWVSLLKSLEIIEAKDQDYSYGSMWSLLYEKSNNWDVEISKREIRLQYLIMSTLLQEKFPYINDVMNLKGIRRILNVNNSYYKPCIEAEKLLQFRPKTILFNYIRDYGKLQFPLISSSLMELLSVGLLELKEERLMGNESYLEKMLELSTSRQVSLPL